MPLQFQYCSAAVRVRLVAFHQCHRAGPILSDLALSVFSLKEIAAAIDPTRQLGLVVLFSSRGAAGPSRMLFVGSLVATGRTPRFRSQATDSRSLLWAGCCSGDDVQPSQHLRNLLATLHHVQRKHIPRQIMDCHTRTHFTGDVAQVPMVGEIDHLAHLRHF